MQPPQMPMLHHQGSAGSLGGQQLYGPGAGLQAMGAAGYGALGMGGGQRGMYQMGGQAQFMSNQQHGQGWPPGAQGQGQGGGQWNPGFQ
jgi:hypothetical protein